MADSPQLKKPPNDYFIPNVSKSTPLKRPNPTTLNHPTKKSSFYLS